MFDTTETKLKGTGNSRYLKSVPNFLTLYPNFEAFAQAMIAGTLPVDLSGLQAAGVQTSGTPYSKATCLPDSVEQAIWGSAANRNIGQALQQLRNLIATAQNTANLKGQIAVGNYVGTGDIGVDNPTTLTFNFEPKVVMLPLFVRNKDQLYGSPMQWQNPVWISPTFAWPSEYTQNVGFTGFGEPVYGKKVGNKISWYISSGDSSYQYNASGFTYFWAAFS